MSVLIAFQHTRFMTKPIKIQTIVDISPSLAEQIDSYLTEKETDLAKEIVRLIPMVEGDAEKPELQTPEGNRVRLSDAVEVVAKKIRAAHDPRAVPLTGQGWLSEIRRMNQAFWEYIEVLEGGVTELFLLIGRAGLERWTSQMFDGVHAIKEVLIHRIEDATWAVRRLENHLKDYRTLCETKKQKSAFWKKWVIWWQPVLDPALLIHLGKSDKFLKSQFKLFADHYHAYRKMWDEVFERSQKLRSFHILSSLEESDQRLFADLVRHIRLWETNHWQKTFPQEEAVHALKRRVRPEQAAHFFTRYKEALREAFFRKSRELKKNRKSQKHRKEIQDQLIIYRKEVRALINTAGKYREFLLRTDPDPYVRSRWGFTEWIVGPEPLFTQKFIHIVYEGKDLKELLDSFIKSLSEPAKPFSEFADSDLALEIDTTLHEMSQPLNTEEIMEKRGFALMEALEESQEMGSSEDKMVDFVSEVLLRAMRADVKYHVLQKNPLFVKLYHLHQGIVGDLEDESYRLWKEKLKKTLHAVEEAFQKADRHMGPEDIEALRNDLRADLQDFLGSMQRKTDEKLGKQQRQLLKQQLLEVRFLCSQFLSFLGEKTMEGQPAKRLFLFIDSYLDSAETVFEDTK